MHDQDESQEKISEDSPKWGVRQWLDELEEAVA